MGRRPRRRESSGEKPKAGGGIYFGNILPGQVRDVMRLYQELYEKRYGCGAPVTGKARSKLADAVAQVKDVVVVKRAMRAFMADDTPKKAGHSIPWFVAVMGEYIARTSEEVSGGKKIARRGDEDFEREVETFKRGAREKDDAGRKRARAAGAGEKVRRKRRR